MTLRPLLLLPLGPPFPELELVEWLGRALERRLLVRVRIEGEHPLRPPAASSRASADEALDQLIGLYPPLGDRSPLGWTLGLTAADLYIPDRPFVLGAAAVGGAWAVVSTARLRTEDDSRDRELLRERLLKEALHELGHVATLPHCDSPRCLMTCSADVDAVDRKGADFCEACSRTLATLDPPFAAR